MNEQEWFLREVERFEWHFKTHVFPTAQVLAVHFKNNTCSPFSESGFFIIGGVVPYFESLGQHLRGSGAKKEQKVFKEGFKEVYERTLENNWEMVADRVEKDVRVGLFHDAAVRGRTELSRHFTVAFRLTPERLEVNPFLLVQDLTQHMTFYVACLRGNDPRYTHQREMFANRRRQIAEEFANLPPVLGQSTTTPNPNDPRFLPRPYNPDGTLPTVSGTSGG